MVKKLVILLLLGLSGCVAPRGFGDDDCRNQVRGVALWFQPGYGNRFDQERAAALKARSDHDYPDKERLYRYLESVTCQ